MGLIRIIIIILAVTLITTGIKKLLAGRGKGLLGKGKQADFISEELYKLNELKNRGILTEEEFKQQKRKLLGR